ncbi:MAG: sulfotransferase [Nocardioidaceae bacterium]|nr:sulfotransferase [Nocardioidaceae bacterium]
MSQPPAPTFAIAGAARAGSTAVAEAVRRHPDAFVCQPKEPHYYALANTDVSFTGPGDDITINRVAVTDRTKFLELFTTTAATTARGDGSVSTLYYYDRSIPVMKDVNPDMRVVIILRHPVDRAYSSYQYLRVRGFEPLDDFLTAVSKEEDRKRDNWHHLWHYTSMSYYASSVAAFKEKFGPSRVHVLLHDDLTAEPAPSINAVYEFLGLDPRLAPAEVARVNVSGKPRRAGVQQAISWASRHEAVRSGLKRVVPFSLRERIRSANLQPNSASTAEFSELQSLFREDLLGLQDVLGRSLAPWLSPDR